MEGNLKDKYRNMRGIIKVISIILTFSFKVVL